jgi:hypothetical protein
MYFTSIYIYFHCIYNSIYVCLKYNRTMKASDSSFLLRLFLITIRWYNKNGYLELNISWVCFTHMHDLRFVLLFIYWYVFRFICFSLRSLESFSVTCFVSILMYIYLPLETISWHNSRCNSSITLFYDKNCLLSESQIGFISYI